MSPRLLRSLLLAALAASAAFAQVEKVGTSAESSVGHAPSLSGAALTAAPSPVSLTVAPVSAAPALVAPPAAFSAQPARGAAPVEAKPAAAPLAPSLAAPAPLPEAAAAPGVLASPAAKSAGVVEGSRAADASDEAGSEAEVGSGRALFDAAAPAKDDSPGLWTKLKSLAGFGERVPAWPGAAGDTVRVGKRSFTLGARVADGVWRTSGDLHLVKLAPPGRSLRAEAEALGALAGTDVPHLALTAVSADGRALVTDFTDDQDARALLAHGFEKRHQEGWAELAARLIRAGATADLSPGNLIWQRWRTRWVLSDARGVRRAGPGEVLASLLTPEAAKAGLKTDVFLAGVRARLGADSPAWERTLAALRPGDRAALDAHDRALPPAPRPVFGPAVDSPFPDDVGPASRISRALGYDPLAVRMRTMLHADDPGKLNTQVFSVAPEGKKKVAVKIAEWGMIRRELAIRRVIRRWFGRYFDAPSAFGVERGWESYLVMEFNPGSRDEYGRLPLEQRAALAVLAHAFGLGDMNTGNVLYAPGTKPVLLDFEIALSRRTPVAGRMPDEGIAMEMPWVSRWELNRAEDYQPAVRAWRALWAEPASKAAFVSDLRAAGYTAEEAAILTRVVDANTADLDWSIANDVDFANQFAAKKKN